MMSNALWVSHRESLRCMLWSAIQTPTDQHMFFIKTRHLYSDKNVFRLYRLNQKCGHRGASNLHAILFAKYCTQLHMMDKCNEVSFGDPKVNDQFGNLLRRQDITTPEELGDEYLKIVQAVGHPSCFKAMERHMADMTPNHFLYENFIMGAHEAGTRLQQELTKDIQSLTPWSERALQWASEHRFVSGWITATGVCGLAIASKFFL